MTPPQILPYTKTTDGWYIIKNGNSEIQIVPVCIDGSYKENAYMSFIPITGQFGTDDGMNGRTVTGIPHANIKRCFDEIKVAFPEIEFSNRWNGAIEAI